MIHPHLGKRDLSKKKFYNIIYLLTFLTFVVVSIVLWQVESRNVDTDDSSQTESVDE